LAGKGFKEVYNLKGGIHAWQGLKTVGPADAGMVFLRGDESPGEIIVLAYGMEAGLGSFYRAMATSNQDTEVSGLFSKLSEVEDRHKKRLFDLYVDIDPSVSDQEIFESKIVSDVMEGGLTTQEFLDQNEAAMQTVPGILNIVMMLEAQALDLYLRYSERIKDDKTKSVLYDIGEDEKTHLAALGRLMGRKV
jgi:rubrerythrin